MAYMGWSNNINVHSDATAAIGIARRKGLGKIRHLDTADLWIQDKIRSREINTFKVLGPKTWPIHLPNMLIVLSCSNPLQRWALYKSLDVLTSHLRPWVHEFNFSMFQHVPWPKSMPTSLAQCSERMELLHFSSPLIHNPCIDGSGLSEIAYSSVRYNVPQIYRESFQCSLKCH